MERYLLNHIKKLEEKLGAVYEKVDSLKEVIETDKIDKEELESHISKIDSLNDKKQLKQVYKGNCLHRNVFFDLTRYFDKEEELLFILKLKDSKELEFATDFIESKFTPFLFINLNKIIGVISKSRLKEFRDMKSIPFSEDESLNFFVIFFEMPELSQAEFIKANGIFDRKLLKSSMIDKTFVYYSLTENKILDFDLVEKEKIRKEFSYMEDLKYPDIEQMIKKEIKKPKFVLAVLNRIEDEFDDITKNKGILMVVRRIIKYIAENQNDSKIMEMIQGLSKKLKKL